MGSPKKEIVMKKIKPNQSQVNHSFQERPDILEVIGHYTPLKRYGQEFFGLAPCHNDRHPSLRVNPDKQVWFCDPCSAGGDVIRFVEIAEKCSFKEAIKILGITSERLPLVKRQEDARRLEAQRVATWADGMTAKCNAMLWEVGQQIRLAAELKDTELLNSLGYDWHILETLADDLQDKNHVLDLYQQRESIGNLLIDARLDVSSMAAWTPEYRERVDRGVAILAPYFDEIYLKQRRAA
jgi:CHC2 zinc finger